MFQEFMAFQVCFIYILIFLIFFPINFLNGVGILWCAEMEDAEILETEESRYVEITN